ncbi:DUF5990 family protein [Streptomyces sp. NPDC050418]|uniref:DUF5990 family protein n=1 Tax=Streptomyces sp. NPDC050418 TaxID=3365612 RepID=UPI0037B6E805
MTPPATAASATTRGELRLRLVGRDLPGRSCGSYDDVHVAVQRGRDPEGPVAGDAGGAVWEFTVGTVTTADGTVDFRGPYVHGRREARFLYLTWGELPQGGEFAMFRRAKIFFADLPDALVESGAAEGSLPLTDECGMPLCAAVRPPLISWRPLP